MKNFVFSDVHGYYDEMITALNEAGYEEGNTEHRIIFCGDMFDRGSKNREILNFFIRQKNAVLVKGNHDERMMDILDGAKIESYDEHNKTTDTLREFFGEDCVDSGYLHVRERDKPIEDLLRQCFRSMKNYCEIGDYIFTHGWLPTLADGREIMPDHGWRDADELAWRKAIWTGWYNQYRYYHLQGKTPIEGKIIVCGHRPASWGDAFDKSRASYDASVFYGNGLIAIDALTTVSGRVNVLVVKSDG